MQKLCKRKGHDRFATFYGGPGIGSQARRHRVEGAATRVPSPHRRPNQKDRLGNAALKPSATDVAAASAAAQDLLRLRFSTPLFRLGSADLINAKVGFPVSGTADAHPGVVVMRIDDTVGADVDPALKGVLVVVNASPSAVSQKVPALAGTTLSLSPVQASGSDAVVKGTTWDPATGTATVPARTVAVLLQR